MRRARHAVRLFGCGCAPMLLMAGGYGPRRRPDPPVTEARALADLALAAGVPENRIVLEQISRRTIENAACAAACARAHGWRRVLVVTDAFHLPRAVLCFRMARLDCAGSPVWRWRPGRFAVWAAGWPREILALGFYAWLALTGRARSITNAARAEYERQKRC
ncbi:MAG: YdcF family protein [Rhodospirillales bacterium]